MSREWPRYCRKACWTKMIKMVQMTIYSELDFILVHFGLKRSILVRLGPPTVLWPFLDIKMVSILVLDCIASRCIK